MAEPFESVDVSIPLHALHELTDKLRARPTETLVCPVQSPRRDSVMLHLVLALLPALLRPTEANTLFSDHVCAAIRVHLAQTYGGHMAA